MASTFRYGFFICFIVISLILSSSSASMSRPPRNNDISTMADALKYLQDLDTYYGDRARVRFGKRASLAQLLRGRIFDNSELAHTLDYSPSDEPF